MKRTSKKSSSSSRPRKSPSRKTPSWFLYILQCRDGSLYTGITKDLKRRLDQHNQGKASRFTRARLPAKMIHSEPCRTHSQALKKEWAVKSLSRREKEIFLKEKMSAIK